MGRIPEDAMKPKTSMSDEIRQKIATLAYFIWEREGRPDGRQADHWALAEAEILSELQAEKVAPVKPAAAKTGTGKTGAAKKPAVKPKAVEKKPVESKGPPEKPVAAQKPDAPAKKKTAAQTKKAVKPKVAKTAKS